MLLRCPSCSARYEVAAGAWPSDPAADGSLLLRPRKVRCRRCQEVWLATPEAEDEIYDPGPPITEGQATASLPPFFANRPRAARISATETPAADPKAPVLAREKESAEEQPERRRRVWPWLLAAVAGVVVAYGAVATDRIRPEAYGLPPLADWAKPDLASLALPELGAVAAPFPEFSLPEVSLPQAPAPRLTLSTDAVIRSIPGGGTVWDVTGTIANPTRTRLPIPPIELELLGSDGASLASWSVRPPAEALAPGSRIAFDTSALNPPAGATRLRVTLKPASLARL